MDREEREALGEKVRTALGLHRSMALCGEQATTKSERAFGEGMDALVALLDELAARDERIAELEAELADHIDADGRWVRHD